MKMDLSNVVSEVSAALGMRDFTLTRPNRPDSPESQRWLAGRAGVTVALRDSGYSFPTIASLFGGRHHTTVMNSIMPTRLEAAQQHKVYWDAWRIASELLIRVRQQQEREEAAAREAVERAKAAAPEPEPAKYYERGGVLFLRADRQTMARMVEQGLAGHSAAQRMERIGE